MIDIKVTRRDGQSPRIVITHMTSSGDIHQIVRDKNDSIDDAINRFLAGETDENQLIAELSASEDAAEQIASKVNHKLRRVTSHISTDGLHVFIDNETFGRARLDTTLEDHLVKLMLNNCNEHDWVAWSRFAERLYANTAPDIREQLFRWLTSLGWLTVDTDGCLIGYRGCQDDGMGTPQSVHAGPAIVDGVHMNGHIPNKLGSIIEMPRHSVEHDATNGCASGLHVGTLDYAAGWAPSNGYVIKVRVAPEDIVSVPFECDSQKMRVCRFEVIDVMPASDFQKSDWADEITWGGFDDDDDDDDIDDDDDDCCGCCHGDCNGHCHNQPDDDNPHPNGQDKSDGINLLMVNVPF
jgi:hypothetical protein